MEEYIKLDLGFTKVFLIKAKDGYIQFDAGYESNVKKGQQIIL